jgi:SAM-dependent methyltransferase
MKTRECLSDLTGWMENQNAEFDRFADSYDEILADPLRRWFAHSNEFFHRRKLEILRSSLSAAGKSPGKLDWLDLGCGRGDLLRMGRAEFASASGCDVSPASLKYCAGMSVRQQKQAQSAIALFTSSCLVSVAASPSSVGFVVTNGQAQVDGVLVQGNSTLFQGSVVQAGSVTSDLMFPGGSNLLLQPDSAVKVYREYAVLQRGGAIQRGAHALVADGLKVSSLSPQGAVFVDLQDRSHLKVAAQGGSAEVRNPAGGSWLDSSRAKYSALLSRFRSKRNLNAIAAESNPPRLGRKPHPINRGATDAAWHSP